VVRAPFRGVVPGDPGPRGLAWQEGLPAMAGKNAPVRTRRVTGTVELCEEAAPRRRGRILPSSTKNLVLARTGDAGPS
jgi:hypothetical protein